MKLKSPGNLVLAVLMLAVTMVGCTHQLKIKNLSAYRTTSITPMEKTLRIGIRSTGGDISDQQLTHLFGTSLMRNNLHVTTAINNDNSNLDVLANVSVVSDNKGSGWNFLINFPGFLVWAPAWHGYKYQVTRDITVNLSDAKTGKPIDTIKVPVVLNIRHANIDRTWTEVSWFEFGIIAFVGGIVFIGYDDDVTPLVQEKAGPVIAEYVAEQISKSLASFRPVASEKPAVVAPAAGADSVKEKLGKLNTLKENGIVTEDEYQTKRQAILNNL
jgi:hypothetical protein